MRDLAGLDGHALLADGFSCRRFLLSVVGWIYRLGAAQWLRPAGPAPVVPVSTPPQPPSAGPRLALTPQESEMFGRLFGPLPGFSTEPNVLRNLTLENQIRQQSELEALRQQEQEYWRLAEIRHERRAKIEARKARAAKARARKPKRTVVLTP